MAAHMGRIPLVASGWLSEGSDARTQLDYIFTSKGSGEPRPGRLVSAALRSACMFLTLLIRVGNARV